VEDLMLARVTRVKIKRDHIDDAVQTTDQEIIPDLKDDTGLAGFYVLGNRISGDTIVVTIWDDREAEEASREKLSQRFGMLGDYLASPPDAPAAYEVLNSYIPEKAPTA
jgi:quinol monooxygenase YgiN